MFTGIVQELGEVIAGPGPVPEPGSDGSLSESTRSLELSAPLATADTSDLTPGGSIAVDGVCLTATDVADGRLGADLTVETLERTSLGSLAPGMRVNLERPARVGAPLDGHVVQGHVDGVGRIVEHRTDDVLRVQFPARLARYVAEKGSIAVDGVSLTVVEVGDDWFTVALIPATLAATTLGVKQVGDPVNLETDVLAKYVERLVAR